MYPPPGVSLRLRRLFCLLVWTLLAFAGSLCLSSAQNTYQFVRAFGGPTAGQILHPYRMTLDSAGNIYVINLASNHIEKFDHNGNFLLEFGGSGRGNGLFDFPFNLARDSSDNLFIVDLLNFRIQKLDKNGNYLSQFGSFGTGNGQFMGISGIAVDKNANIFVADSTNNRIQKFDASGNFVSKFGTPGNGNGQLSSPQDLAVDSGGNVFVRDAGNERIQKFSASGTYLAQFANGISANGMGIDSSGNIYLTTDNKDYEYDGNGNYVSQFGAGGNGITTDSGGNVYITSLTGNFIQKTDRRGNLLLQFGTGSTGNGHLEYPRGVGVDSSNNIYVADSQHNRIQKFDRNGSYIAQFGVFGSGNGQFNSPQKVAVDSQGNIFVLDTGNVRIQKFDKNGNYLTQFAQNQASSALGVDSSGNVYVGSGVIYKYSNTGTYLMQIGTSGINPGQLVNPIGVGVDSQGNIIVADTFNSRVIKFDHNGNYVSQFNSNVVVLFGFALDSSANVYLTDGNQNRVVKFDAGGQFLTSVGMFGSDDGEFFFPSGIAVDGSGNLVVADTNNDRVDILTPANAALSGMITLEDCVNEIQPVVFEFRPTDGSGSFQRTVTLNSSGGYGITNLPGKVYNVWIKGSKWLARVMPLDLTHGNVAGFAVSLPAGDVNGDNFCDIDDLGELAFAFGTIPTSPHWDPNADLNCDGKVDINDLVLLANNYGAQGDF